MASAPKAALGAWRLFLTECRFFPEFVQDALRASYKYRSASCAARQGGSCFPRGGRGSEHPRGAGSCACWGAGRGGCVVQEPPSSRGRDCLLLSSPGGRAKPCCSISDWLCFGVSRKEHVGKPWWTFWGPRQEEKGEVHSETVDSKVLLGTVPAPF